MFRILDESDQELKPSRLFKKKCKTLRGFMKGYLSWKFLQHLAQDLNSRIIALFITISHLYLNFGLKNILRYLKCKFEVGIKLQKVLRFYEIMRNF